jgi:hypothetical protein
MSEEEQRIAIAEACGWRFESYEDRDGKYTVPIGVIKGQEYTAGWSKVPDYLHDLNAMHEAERMLDITKVEKYCATLVRIVRHSLGIEDHESIHPTRFAVYATAAQRAEAFLKTLGLWKP